MARHEHFFAPERPEVTGRVLWAGSTCPTKAALRRPTPATRCEFAFFGGIAGLFLWSGLVLLAAQLGLQHLVDPPALLGGCLGIGAVAGAWIAWPTHCCWYVGEAGLVHHRRSRSRCHTVTLRFGDADRLTPETTHFYLNRTYRHSERTLQWFRGDHHVLKMIAVFDKHRPPSQGSRVEFCNAAQAAWTKYRSRVPTRSS